MFHAPLSRAFKVSFRSYEQNSHVYNCSYEHKLFSDFIVLQLYCYSRNTTCWYPRKLAGLEDKYFIICAGSHTLFKQLSAVFAIADSYPLQKDFYLFSKIWLTSVTTELSKEITYMISIIYMLILSVVTLYLTIVAFMDIVILVWTRFWSKKLIVTICV